MAGPSGVASGEVTTYRLPPSRAGVAVYRVRMVHDRRALPNIRLGEIELPVYDLLAGVWQRLPRTLIEVCSPDTDTVIVQRGDGIWDLSVCPVLLLVRKTSRPNAVWPLAPTPTLPYRSETIGEAPAWLR